MASNEAIARGTHKLGVQIALSGGLQGRSSYVANWSPYCDSPVQLKRRVTSRMTSDGVNMGNLKISDPLQAMEVSALVPCRKCKKCLQWRQCQWRERAMQEIVLANRTWFVTLTFSATHLAGILMEAKSSSTRDVESAAYAHVQRFFKRLRKGGFTAKIGDTVIRSITAPAVFRYLAIYERGEENGRSHYHLLLHETGIKPITKLQIEAQWRSFVHARLVRGDEVGRSASYLTKYATKSFEIRPRASARYGKNLFSPVRLRTGENNPLVVRGRIDDAHLPFTPCGLKSV